MDLDGGQMWMRDLQEGKLRLGPLAIRRSEGSTLLVVSATLGGPGERLHQYERS